MPRRHQPEPHRAARKHPSRSPRLARFLRRLVRLRGSPEAIAGGVAIGVLVAFTPTIGFQTLLVLALATLMRANRPASIVPTWISNPVTAVPIYLFTYYVGSFLWPGPETETVANALREASRELETLGFLALRRQLGVFVDLGFDVFVPMMIGGLLVGGVAAAIAYPLTRRAVVALRARAGRRRRNRRARRKPDRRGRGHPR
ncbi:MAG: DUF2062 domain-containing protein [Myxococcales bacterium]|nr:DUF2062 domain-containing protein [Myxococcales bacterium]